MLPRCRANKSKPVTLRHFSHWPRRIGSVGEGGLKSEGGKGEGESCWKSGRGRVRLYTWCRAGLADEVEFDAMSDARGHGAIKPQEVVHRLGR
jgi:hypothetical protein